MTTMLLRYIDWILALAFLVVGFAIGYRLLLDFGVTDFSQEWMPATVMWACGHGLYDPAYSPPALTAFLKMNLPSFDCHELFSVAHADHVSVAMNSYLYLGFAAAICWRLLGVSYTSLAPLLGVLYGAYIIGCFVLLRLFFNRWLATFATVVLSFSPAAILMLRNLRDFSKAPFIIWSLVLLILTVRERHARRLLILAGLTGLVVGIGIGFRPDLKLMALLGAVVLAFGLDRIALNLRSRISALCIFLGFVGTLGLSIAGKGVDAGYYALQGAAEPFREFVGVTKPSYDLGYLYFDAYTFTAIGADLRRQDPISWDLHESTISDSNDSYVLTRANAYVIGWMPLFAGDIVTRGLKSAAWIAGYYALYSPTHAAPDPHHHPRSEAHSNLVNLVEPFFLYLSQTWLPYIGLFGFLALVFRTYDRSPREAVCISAIVAALLMPLGIQFSARHFFQYEVIFWLGILSAISLPFEFTRLRKSLPTFGRWLSVPLVLGGLGYACLLLIQDELLTREVLRILDANRESVPTTNVRLDDRNTLIEVPIPPAATGIPGFSAKGIDESLRRTLFTDEHWRISALTVADRLLISIGGPSCLPGQLYFTLAYEGFLGFSRSLTIDVSADGNKTLLIAPAFYNRLERFRGIAISSDRTNCIADVSKVLDDRKLPIIFSAALAPQWRSEPKFQRFGGF
jgi:hypothetical protein